MITLWYYEKQERIKICLCVFQCWEQKMLRSTFAALAYTRCTLGKKFKFLHRLEHATFEIPPTKVAFTPMLIFLQGFHVYCIVQLANLMRKKSDCWMIFFRAENNEWFVGTAFWEARVELFLENAVFFRYSGVNATNAANAACLLTKRR